MLLLFAGSCIVVWRVLHVEVIMVSDNDVALAREEGMQPEQPLSAAAATRSPLAVTPSNGAHQRRPIVFVS